MVRGFGTEECVGPCVGSWMTSSGRVAFPDWGTSSERPCGSYSTRNPQSGQTFPRNGPAGATPELRDLRLLLAGQCLLHNFPPGAQCCVKASGSRLGAATDSLSDICTTGLGGIKSKWNPTVRSAVHPYLRGRSVRGSFRIMFSLHAPRAM